MGTCSSNAFDPCQSLTIFSVKTSYRWSSSDSTSIICCCDRVNQVAFGIKVIVRKIMSQVSQVSTNTDFCKQQEAKKQRQRKALGCNPQKHCILKCAICAQENRKATTQKAI
jgi:hypothetical protein